MKGFRGAARAFSKLAWTLSSSQPLNCRLLRQGQRLSKSGKWPPLSHHPHHDRWWTQASSVSSAVSTKGNHESSAENVEGVPEAKDQPPKSEQLDKEEAMKCANKEKLLKEIRKMDTMLAKGISVLSKMEKRSVIAKGEHDNLQVREQKDTDNTRKFAIQDFAKSLLDVADNLGRALMTIPTNVRKEILTDQSQTGNLFKGLVQGMLMTEEELMKVLKKFGVEKFEPLGQQFDPNSHLALFEVMDPTKAPGTVARVAKVGYMLHDRVLRPAEVGVVKSQE